jgi:hypothetical protein
MIRFLPGRVNWGWAKEEIKAWNPQRKVLVIDDTVASGRSVENIARALKELDIKFDFAVVSYLADPKSVDVDYGAEYVFVGGVEENDVYSGDHLSGVRQRGGHFAERINNVDVHASVEEARGDADMVAGHIIEWYESQKNEKE